MNCVCMEMEIYSVIFYTYVNISWRWIWTRMALYQENSYISDFKVMVLLVWA